jgi:hypothetical protein
VSSASQKENLRILADALGVKVRDEAAAVKALSSFVSACSMDDEDEEEAPKSAPGIAMILAGKKGK